MQFYRLNSHRLSKLLLFSVIFIFNVSCNKQEETSREYQQRFVAVDITQKITTDQLPKNEQSLYKGVQSIKTTGIVDCVSGAFIKISGEQYDKKKQLIRSSRPVLKYGLVENLFNHRDHKNCRKSQDISDKLIFSKKKYLGSYKLDTSDFKPGELTILRTRGVDIGIYKRTEKEVLALKKHAGIQKKSASIPLFAAYGWPYAPDDLSFSQSGSRSKILDYFVFYADSNTSRYGLKCSIDRVLKKPEKNVLAGNCAGVNFSTTGKLDRPSFEYSSALLVPPHEWTANNQLEIKFYKNPILEWAKNWASIEYQVLYADFIYGTKGRVQSLSESIAAPRLKSILFDALNNGNTALAENVANKGANFENDKEFATHYLELNLARGRTDIADFLLQRGLNLNHPYNLKPALCHKLEPKKIDKIVDWLNKNSYDYDKSFIDYKLSNDFKSQEAVKTSAIKCFEAHFNQLGVQRMNLMKGNMSAHDIAKLPQLTIKNLPKHKQYLPSNKISQNMIPENSDKDTPQNGSSIYAKRCAICHNTGVMDAPKISDRGEWQKRLREGGINRLYKRAWNGYQRMPPRGMCPECSRADINAIVDYILGKNALMKSDK